MMAQMPRKIEATLRQDDHARRLYVASRTTSAHARGDQGQAAVYAAAGHRRWRRNRRTRC